jgi:hypothetical protein
MTGQMEPIAVWSRKYLGIRSECLRVAYFRGINSLALWPRNSLFSCYRSLISYIRSADIHIPVRAPSYSLLTVDIDAKNLLLELPGPMSADFAKTNHGLSEGAGWARYGVPEEAVVIPGSSARIRESESIQINVAEEQYTSLNIKLIGFGHGKPFPWCCLTGRSFLGARARTIASST